MSSHWLSHLQTRSQQAVGHVSPWPRPEQRLVPITAAPNACAHPPPTSSCVTSTLTQTHTTRHTTTRRASLYMQHSATPRTSFRRTFHSPFRSCQGWSQTGNCGYGFGTESGYLLQCCPLFPTKSCVEAGTYVSSQTCVSSCCV